MAARDVSGHMTTTNFWMGTLAWCGQEHGRSANPSCPSPAVRLRAFFLPQLSPREPASAMGKGYSPRIAANPYIVGSFACIGGGLFGLDISSMSGVLSNPSYLRVFNHPDSNAQGAMVASMPAGSLFGALTVSWLADKIGRKRVIQISGLVWVVGSILQCAAVNRGMLVVGRIISGFAIGLASSTVPLYQSEITPPAIRGRMVSLQQWAITWGILIQYFIQFGCSYIDGVASFRIPWGLQLIPGLILSIGMTWFPESPRWLMDHDRYDEALEVLSDVHGHGDPNAELVQLEYNEIREAVEFERKEGAKKWSDLLRPGVFRRVVLGTSLQMWSQLTGMNVMMYYVVYVFEGAGIVGRRGNLIASSVQYVLNVVATIPAIIFIDKWGRRPMLLIGLAFMSFWLFLVGGLQGGYGNWGTSTTGDRVWVIEGHDSVTKGIIVCSYLDLPAACACQGSIVVDGHELDLQFCACMGRPPGFATISYKTYFIFATFNAAAFIHVLFMYPETKGRTLEEIEEIFAQGHTFAAWKIKNDVGHRTLAQVKGATQHEQSSDEKIAHVHDEKAHV
ncbi:Sugar (and other) transporter [Rhizoctonia solani]|uniref:Sugar (And other) transporter n=1 Tax=Rhizoctonia solani TaxID=456999 RepID=A0A8H8SWU1_9AGAM|nr:Sugar (and other) transporter [Rhizoctonia solani]QRW20714.1 Sugar (and other) transporter [Rhizoctonia solani]